MLARGRKGGRGGASVPAWPRPSDGSKSCEETCTEARGDHRLRTPPDSLRVSGFKGLLGILLSGSSNPLRWEEFSCPSIPMAPGSGDPRGSTRGRPSGEHPGGSTAPAWHPRLGLSLLKAPSAPVQECSFPSCNRPGRTKAQWTSDPTMLPSPGLRAKQRWAGEVAPLSSLKRLSKPLLLQGRPPGRLSEAAPSSRLCWGQEPHTTGTFLGVPYRVCH